MVLNKKTLPYLIVAILGFIINVVGIILMLYIALAKKTSLANMLYVALFICLFGCMLITISILLYSNKQSKGKFNE